MVIKPSSGVMKGSTKRTSKREDPEESDRKIRQTVAWWNRYGELQQQIHYDSVKEPLTRISSRQAMQLLNSLEDKKDRLVNPTGWIRAECQRLGGGEDRELDTKIRRTIGWINHQKVLKEPLQYVKVASALAQVEPQAAGRILHDLCEKAHAIKDPIGYIVTAVRRQLGEEKPVLDQKVKSTISWWNRYGNLRAAIDYHEVLVLFSQLEVSDALFILSTLEGKETEVENPTAWVCAAARKRLEKLAEMEVDEEG
mmetsp:Transcript_36176/g.88604  ORF Transcript_36176/g.88604 Transcript_36176/m.88604 type:complete len:254 (+) Transcript_36176:1-762(+)